MNTVKLVAVFAENKPGWLARVTQTLASASINIHWLGIASLERFGVIRLLVNHVELATHQLQAADLTVSLVDVLAVEAPDQPGSLHSIAHALSNDGISLQNCSGFVFNHRAILLLETHELDRAHTLLTSQNFRLLTATELLQL